MCSGCQNGHNRIEFYQYSNGAGEEYETCNFCRKSLQRDIFQEKKEEEDTIVQQKQMFKVYKKIGHFNSDPPSTPIETDRGKRKNRRFENKKEYVPKKREYKEKREVKIAKTKQVKRKKTKKETKRDVYLRLKSGRRCEEVYMEMYQKCYLQMTPQDLLQCIHIFLQKESKTEIMHCAKSGIENTKSMQEMKTFYYYRLFASNNIKDVKKVLENMLDVFTGVYAHDKDTIVSAIDGINQKTLLTPQQVMDFFHSRLCL